MLGDSAIFPQILDGDGDHDTLSCEDKTGLSQDVLEMKIDCDSDTPILAKNIVESNSPSLSASSSKSGCSVIFVKEEGDGHAVDVDGRVSLRDNEKVCGKRSSRSMKRKYSSTSSSSGESDDDDSDYEHHSAKKNKVHVKNEPIGSNFGRVFIEGLVVTKKTGQTFYPQDTVFLFNEDDDGVDAVRDIITDNLKKWNDMGCTAVAFSNTFEGVLPTVIGGFTRGFKKSHVKK